MLFIHARKMRCVIFLSLKLDTFFCMIGFIPRLDLVVMVCLWDSLCTLNVFFSSK